jgi:hypothetical protein
MHYIKQENTNLTFLLFVPAYRNITENTLQKRKKLFFYQINYNVPRKYCLPPTHTKFTHTITVSARFTKIRITKFRSYELL